MDLDADGQAVLVGAPGTTVDGGLLRGAAYEFGLAAGAHVLGEVNVLGGAGLVSTAAVVQGPVSAVGAAVVDLAFTSVTGPVLVSGATQVVSLFGNQVTGSVSVVGSDTGSRPIVVSGNTIIGSLSCFANTPAPTDHGLPAGQRPAKGRPVWPVRVRGGSRTVRDGTVACRCGIIATSLSTFLPGAEAEHIPLRDPQELYEVADDLPELRQPVMIQAMSGFVDAGGAARLAREQLLTAGSPQLAARFDLDQLFDYRSRRPTMLFIEDHWESYDQPALALHLLRDQAGTPYLLLAGPEPDLQWDRFVAAVVSVVERLRVRLTVGINAIPMAVPHTRPTGVTAHATRAELVADYQPWLHRVQVPASAGNLLELRLGEAGHDAIGFAAHVPHYLAQNDYPAAAETLLTSISRATGLSLLTDPLHEAAEAMRLSVDAQIAKADEVAAHVRGLEEQYDAVVQSRQGATLLSDLSSLPTAEELGAELERFLAQQPRPGDPPPAGSP